MIVSVCGNGYSGSGAVVDYLRENDHIAVPPYDIEFTFLYDVDAIDDLKHHLVTRPVRFYSSDAAIKRFKAYIKSVNTPNSLMRKVVGMNLYELTDKYLNEIVQLRWHGWWHFDIRNANLWVRNWNFRIMPRIASIIKILFNKRINIYPHSEMSISIDPINFEAATKKYISDIISLFNPENKSIVVLNQLYPVGKYGHYASYFEDEVKTITVQRDPRDIYIAAKKINTTYSSWIPTSNVNDFITYFKLINKRDIMNEPNELIIYFEDLIYKYAETSQKIDDFLGIKSPKIKKYFNPERSIDNTQLFLKYTEYSEDIIKIEKELHEFLYDYSNIKKRPQWLNSF